MEFGLLGTLEVRADDGPLILARPKQRALLALLVLHANRVIAREQLIEELWGERVPETAVKALQVYVSQLRGLLPDGMLVTRAPGYVLEVAPEAVDVRRFEQLVAEARGAPPAQASSLLHQALALWRGPPLVEFDETFLRIEAARLEELRLAALEERIEADLALGRHADLVAELDALVAAQPHRERLRGQLMVALYRSGRQTDALEAYRAARAALDELGLEPSGALRELQRRILRQDEALAVANGQPPQRVVLPGPLLPESPFPFVGRADERTALRAALEQTHAGEGRLVLLAGEAGAGKTRLIRELAREAAAQGLFVLYGASDAAVSTPYQPLREWLEFLLRAFDTDALVRCLGGCEVLARLVPELERLTGPPPAADPERDGYLLQSAALSLLRRLARSQPLVLVADDLHWADSQTLQLVRRLARIAPEAQLLVLAGYRERGGEIGPELSAALAGLARLDGVTRLSLGSLSDEEIAAFVRATTHAEPVAGLVSAIGELSGGTPLLLCELWRDLRESDGLDVSEGGVRLARPLSEVRGSEQIRDVIGDRLLRVAAETAAVLEVAAVAGPRFELPVVSQAAALDDGALIAALVEAARHGIVDEPSEHEAACRFTHELVRRAVYDRIAGFRRAELHLRVGEALERAHAADPARVLPELAHHFALAAPLGDSARAADYNLRAGEAAIQAAAYEEAIASLTLAVDLGIADSQERTRVRIELAWLLRCVGRRTDARRVLAAAVDALDERRLAARAAFVRTGIGGAFMGDPFADPAQMREKAESLLKSFAQLGDGRGVAMARRSLALVFRRAGRVAECCDVLEQALEEADSSVDQDTRRQIAGSLALALCDGPVPVCDATRRCDSLLEATVSGSAFEAVIERCVSALYAMAGRTGEALELVHRSSLVLDPLNESGVSWVYRTVAAQTKELAGDRLGAEQELLAIWQRFDELPDLPIDGRAMNAAYRLALLYSDEGRWNDAERWLEYGSEISVPDHFLQEAVLGLAARALVAAQRGDLEKGLALAARGVELAEQTDMLNLKARVWRVLGEVRRCRGDAAEADEALAKALHFYETKGNVAAAGALRR